MMNEKEPFENIAQLALNIYVGLVVKLMEHEKDEYAEEGKLTVPPCDALARMSFEIAEAFASEYYARREAPKG